MGSKIQVLSDHTINKIAAGEVIENPSSVVKELVENSIDAGSTDICVEIKAGGRQLIRISDNGCGMNADDALLCLERHATSKLKEVEDIHTISTMGFRGEAIPSIASISKFNLLTMPREEENAKGTMVMVDGGKLISCTPAVRDPGTTIEVKSLFFNVPVRKKFLKSPTVDENDISKIMSIIALGNPHIKFQLISDEKNLLLAPLTQKSSREEILKTRIGTVLGNDFLQNCTYIQAENEGISLEGVIGLPTYTRHTRTGQYIFINKRPIVSPLISFAVREGYGTSLIQGRHPVFVLHLNIPGDLVDVNVHPQKREVRIRQDQTLRDLIVRAVEKSSLHKEAPTSPSTFKPKSIFDNAYSFADRPIESKQEAPVAWTFQPKPAPIEPVKIVERPLLKAEESFIAPPRVLATIPRYILLESNGNHPFFLKASSNSGKGGMFLIDQRGAHARVIFEQLINEENKEKLPVQMLLIPHQIDVSLAEADLIRQSIPTLNKLGIHIKEFGPKTFLIDALPQIFGNCHLDLLISDILTNLRNHEDNISEKEQIKQMALTACKASVNGEAKLGTEEAQTLINRLVRCKHPYQCPSGKPTCHHLVPEELVKFFQKPYTSEK